MNDKRKNLKVWLAAVCVTAAGAAMIPATPAEAGMGTGNPPPPPPPPVTRTFRLYEGSTDANLSGLGYPDILVTHTYSLVTATNATKTSGTGLSGGSFTYTVRSDQSPVEHSAQMFGIVAGPGTQDLIVATDAVLKVVVADDEPDFNELATGASPLVTKWKMDFEYQRGGNSAETYSANPSLVNRSFGSRRIPRHLAANAKQVRSNVTKAVFQLHKLEGYDASGTLRLKWLDKKENGRKAVFPGYNSDGGPDEPLVLHKILSVTEK